MTTTAKMVQDEYTVKPGRLCPQRTVRKAYYCASAVCQ